MEFLGLGKTLFNSSACRFTPRRGRPEIELALSERLLRKKASGAWPESAIRAVIGERKGAEWKVGENRDVLAPSAIEDFYDTQFPFYEHLKQKGFDQFARRLNPALAYLTHHRSHAWAATAMSPLRKALIVVIDGAGSRDSDFASDHPERRFLPQARGSALRPSHEERSVYALDDGSIECLEKHWQQFEDRPRGLSVSQGLGTLYEKSAEFIFNSKRAAGKVMGLAAFGRAQEISDRARFLETLPWEKAFHGRSKREWEESGRFSLYADIAASVQAHFEKDLLGFLAVLRSRYPEFQNLILVGGCALNCTTNQKIVQAALFDEVYVPPFPGDESIGLGVAASLYYESEPWAPLPHEEQHGYFGPLTSVPNESQIRALFEGFEITHPDSIVAYAASALAEGQTIAWFQGRSESGPRALGNRSILVRADLPGVKARLNAEVKFREAFRPYGCSVLHEHAHKYFDVPQGFNNPYMSFAVHTRAEHRDRLAEVTHVDGTSRMQTVRSGQNARFHALLTEMGRLTGLPVLLNTSLNVMGEPIVETAEDARRFLLKTPVDGLAIGDYYIRRRSN